METLSNRNEFLFLYDIKMGNPNGDPDENRPRVLPDNTVFVTDVRLKRFVRDYFKTTGQDILVDTVSGKTTNLTGRVVDYLKTHNQKLAQGEEIVTILQEAFIDARLFGSSFAFKKDDNNYEPKPVPKTMTGPVQINMGEVIHEVEELTIHGTSVFSSSDEKTQGTFTQYYGIRYGLIAFSGIANENSAKISRLSDDDYQLLLRALWKSVRESGNTRTKKGQMPHFLLNIRYRSGSQYQIGRLQDYVSTTSEKAEKEYASPGDYKLNIEKLIQRIEGIKHIEAVEYALSPELQTAQDIPSDWIRIDYDN